MFHGLAPKFQGPTPAFEVLTPTFQGLTPKFQGLTPMFQELTSSLLNAGHDIQFERTHILRTTIHTESYRNTITSRKIEQGGWLHVKLYKAASN